MYAYTQVLTQMSAYAQGCPVYVWESCELNVQHYVSPTLGRALLAAMLNYIPLVSELEELLLVLSRSLVVADTAPDTAARQLDS
jgi:hypothetical protein